MARLVTNFPINISGLTPEKLESVMISFNVKVAGVSHIIDQEMSLSTLIDLASFLE